MIRHRLLADSGISKKKSKADVAKIVEKQARGTKVTGAQTDKKMPGDGELDARIVNQLAGHFGVEIT